jgi:hypothetical protein
MTGNSTLGDFSVAVTSAKVQAIFLRKTVGAHKSDVMAVARVFCARIPQTDN